jgi:Ca-activated chloride channel family protein
MENKQTARGFIQAFMLKYRKWVWICGLSVFFCVGPGVSPRGALKASDPPSDLNYQSTSIIRVNSNLVMVPVSVTDAGGRAVTNLDIDDFQIKEDGRIETISKVTEAEQLPLHLALLFDLSGSVNSRFEFEQQAAIRFLETVWKFGDTISIITFSGYPEIRLQTSESLTEALEVLLHLEPTEGPTSFFDAVVVSADILYQSTMPGARQSEIVLSDGEDNRSESRISDALRAVQSSDTLFYSINPSGSSIRLNEVSLQAQSNLATLARETGGAAFVSDQTCDLDEIFDRISAELRAQYLLGYYSSNSRTDGTYRQIGVSIPKQPHLHIRARKGYYAVQK